MAGICLAIATAHADPPASLPAYHLFGLGYEAQDLDAGGGRVATKAAVASITFGIGRWAGFVETAVGAMDSVQSDEPSALGTVIDGRVGGRIRATTLSGSGLTGLDLDVDLGIGAMRAWLDHASLDRAYGFLGWTTQYRAGDRHGGGAYVSLRISAARITDDPTALRAICRGTCPTPGSGLPVDVGMMLSMGALAW